MADANLNKEALKEAVLLGQKIGQPIDKEIIHYAIVPSDCKLESLKAFQYPHGMPPDRIVQTVELRDSESFTAYVNKYADERTAVFAEPTKNSFLAVLDYHLPGKPEFVSHRAGFKMIYDDRWVAWISNDKKVFSQTDFSEFLEDNALDIYRPDSATMLEVARDLRASTDMNFASKVTPKNGQTQFTYTEQINTTVGTGNMDVPDVFSIRIPVFFGEKAVEIEARLRFRISNGKLSFFYKLKNPKEVEEQCFEMAVDAVANAVTKEVFLGSPAL